ncbi:hypothetical protein [Caulobacter sp. SSI4214]|uniref:hypothetical protein n=1 Tax=Caulobacter sp. SSI4214 TaxID=2575739 RepID=UPI00143B0805|nr:hypothetical protein [Caulobacter sp. SSI4214]
MAKSSTTVSEVRQETRTGVPEAELSGYIAIQRARGAIDVVAVHDGPGTYTVTATFPA